MDYNMNIEDILTMMDDALDKAQAVPFSRGKQLINVGEMRSFIHNIRINLPQEIRQAQGIVSQRKSIINDAEREADEVIKRAEMRVKQMVSAQEITRTAETRAQEIMATAQQKSKEMRITTVEYADNMLKQSEEIHSRHLSESLKARQALKSGK
jgi:cell division septum initiation protein DivIVA